jgi:hypothetical protein
MRTFDTPEPITVELDLGAANVDIRATERADTVVRIEPTNAASRADAAAAQQTAVDYRAGRLSITAPKSWRQWLPFSGRESIDVHVELPSGSRVLGASGVVALKCNGRVAECRYKTGAGNMHVEEAGEVQLTAGAGNIDVGYASGSVELKTSSGSVHVANVDGAAVIKNSNGDTSIDDVTGDVRVNAANGNVVIERAHAGIVAKTANGNIRIGNASRGAIVAETARGNVDVGIRDGVAAWLDLNTAFGRVNTELDVSDAPAAGEEFIDVRARTAFGDLTVHRAVSDATA